MSYRKRVEILPCQCGRKPTLQSVVVSDRRGKSKYWQILCKHCNPISDYSYASVQIAIDHWNVNQRRKQNDNDK